jgi:alpha-ketoglutarate-dependent taurine dioxygenase
MESYVNINRRALNASERRVRAGEPEIPLVLEPENPIDQDTATRYLAQNADRILDDVSKHGAILLRRFPVQTAKSFESHVLSIKGLRGMTEPLLEYKARAKPLEDTEFVAPTGIGAVDEKTGGTLDFNMFHTEHYSLPDVPSYICFFCRTPARLGGETGLINMSKVYADLPPRLQETLLERACLVRSVTVSRMADWYGVPAETIVSFCASAGLPLSARNGTRRVDIYKPSVVEHPKTHERSLSINTNFLKGMRTSSIEAFRGDYRGIRWWLHRMAWRNPWRDRKFLRAVELMSRPGCDDVLYMDRPRAGAAGMPTLSRLIGNNDLRALAAAMRRHFASFTWQRGDVLIVDNLKVAHCGMAGFGERKLNVMLCNSRTFRADERSPGLYVAAAEPDYETLGARLKRFCAPDSGLRRRAT